VPPAIAFELSLQEHAMKRRLWFAAVLVLLASNLVAQPQKKNPPAPKGKTKAKAKAKADDRLTLTVVTKTGRTNKFARANKIKIFVLLNADTAHKTQLLNPRKNNFELGATDTFKNIPVNLPLDQIESIRVAVEGDDMWHCESISFQFFQKGLQSREHKFTPDRFLSSAKEKKAFKPVSQLDFKLTPTLAPPGDAVQGPGAGR
jgi:hypothetical protein